MRSCTRYTHSVDRTRRRRLCAKFSRSRGLLWSLEFHNGGPAAHEQRWCVPSQRACILDSSLILILAHRRDKRPTIIACPRSRRLRHHCEYHPLGTFTISATRYHWRNRTCDKSTFSDTACEGTNLWIYPARGESWMQVPCISAQHTCLSPCITCSQYTRFHLLSTSRWKNNADGRCVLVFLYFKFLRVVIGIHQVFDRRPSCCRRPGEPGESPCTM